MIMQSLSYTPPYPIVANALIREVITPGDGTAMITLHTGDVNGSFLINLHCVSYDEINHDIQFYLIRDSIDHELASVPVPRGRRVDLLRGLKIRDHFKLKPGDILKVALREAVKTIGLEITGAVYND